ncbi:MAG: copper chaperone PCu(A)C [Gammaproteobacteria bacterium]|nr:copper chaperone PCu(A)C [Gammaproteobacteria bacterium]
MAQQRITCRFSITFGLLLMLSSPLFAASSIDVTDAWMREAPPNVPMAGYMSVVNRGDASDFLVAASCDDFAVTELHRTFYESDMMRMVRMEAIEIPAGASLLFEPAGYHIMLIGPKKRLLTGEQSQITLHFRHGESQVVTFPVVKQDPQAAAREHLSHGN